MSKKTEAMIESRVVNTYRKAPPEISFGKCMRRKFVWGKLTTGIGGKRRKNCFENSVADKKH
jgi:hypothetical protein